VLTRIHGFARSIEIFTAQFRLLWLVTVFSTVVLEVVPVHLPPLPFYTYKVTKCILFAALGYLTPLTFWRFNHLNRGLLFAAVSATITELLQGFIGNGHALSGVELVAKLAIIFAGFVAALDARYECAISFPGFRICLVSEHLRNR
jgi:hypothetical protein